MVQQKSTVVIKRVTFIFINLNVVLNECLQYQVRMYLRVEHTSSAVAFQCVHQFRAFHFFQPNICLISFSCIHVHHFLYLSGRYDAEMSQGDFDLSSAWSKSMYRQHLNFDK